jgi:hypothetical protein
MFEYIIGDKRCSYIGYDLNLLTSTPTYTLGRYFEENIMGKFMFNINILECICDGEQQYHYKCTLEK